MAIVAFALAAIVAVIIYGIKLVKVIILNWSAIVDWLSSASIIVAVTCAALILISGFLHLVANAHYRQRGLAKLINQLTIKVNEFFKSCFELPSDKQEIISYTIFWTALVAFIVNIFFLANHFDLSRLWLIILGAVVLLGFGVCVFLISLRKWHNDQKKSFSWAIAKPALCALVFAYYLDIFIFSWNRPWISGASFILIAIVYCIVVIQTIKDAQEKKENEKRKAAEEKEYIEQLEKKLGQLSLNDLIISYFSEQKFSARIPWERTVSLYLAADLIIADEHRKLDEDEKIHIAWLLSAKAADYASNFLRIIAQVFNGEDVEALLFSNIMNGQNIMPEAFNLSSAKEDVIGTFLNEEFEKKYQKLIYNSIKKEFAPNQFYGLMNALIYSYGKTWDENQSLKLITRIAEIYNFANDTAIEIWNKNQRHQLLIYLEIIKDRCHSAGVQVSLPEVKK